VPAPRRPRGTVPVPGPRIGGGVSGALHEERGGEHVGGETGEPDPPTVSERSPSAGRPVRGVEDVVVPHAAGLEVALVVPRGRDSALALQLEDGDRAPDFPRVLHADLPDASIRLGAERDGRAARRDQCSINDTAVAQDLAREVECKPLCRTAEVEAGCEGPPASSAGRVLEAHEHDGARFGPLEPLARGDCQLEVAGAGTLATSRSRTGRRPTRARARTPRRRRGRRPRRRRRPRHRGERVPRTGPHSPSLPATPGRVRRAVPPPRPSSRMRRRWPHGPRSRHRRTP